MEDSQLRRDPEPRPDVEGLGTGLDDELYRRLSLMVDFFDEHYKLGEGEFLARVFEAAFELIPEGEKGSLYLLRRGRYEPVYARGYDFRVLSRISFSAEEAFVDFELSEEAPIEAYVTRIEGRDPAKFPAATLAAFRELGTLSGFWSLYAPIKVEGFVRGLISLENYGSSGFSRSSRKLLKYYARLISDFYAQRLYQEKEMGHYREIVDALVSAIEVMDEYTEGHAQRVRSYALLIARRLGLSSRELSDLGTAALLHDIGKLGIPTEVLRKPGLLDEAELEIVRRHPVNARRILGGIAGFERIVDLAYRHHERYDGSGYPEGLAGEAIPLGAQILQLADAFDAMTSDRSYRKARSKAEALGEIALGSGSQFHPEVAEAALQVLT